MHDAVIKGVTDDCVTSKQLLLVRPFLRHQRQRSPGRMHDYAGIEPFLEGEHCTDVWTLQNRVPNERGWSVGYELSNEHAQICSCNDLSHQKGILALASVNFMSIRATESVDT